MRVLVVGGGGLVGDLTLPKLSEKHDITVADLRPPTRDVPFVRADLKNYRAMREAARGQDAVLFMAMGPKDFPDDPESAIAQFDVAVTGLYTVLLAARHEGIGHAVYASSMSVYDEEHRHDGYPDESVPADAIVSYGLAKRLGEEVARAATAEGMSVVALRLCFPTPIDEWPPSGSGGRSVIGTSGPDTARAFLLALDHRAGGYDEFAISGDNQGRMVNIEKARTVLGWQPFDPTA